MLSTKETKNKDEIITFLKSNGIHIQSSTGYNKFETAYYINDSRKFFEETPIIFNISADNNLFVSLPEINDIEFKTTLKLSEQNFKFDEEHETLTIRGEEDYQIVINSIYLDF